MITAFVVCLMCHVLCQLVKTSPHLPFSPASSQTYLSTPSLSKRRIVLSVKVSQSVLFENAAVRMSLKSVRWKESLTPSSQKWTPPRMAFPPIVRRNPPCQTARDPPSVSVGASPGSCPQTAAIVWRCARLCSVIACYHLILLMATSARASSTFQLCVGPAASVALRGSTVVCSALRKGPQVLANFLVQVIQLTW